MDTTLVKAISEIPASFGKTDESIAELRAAYADLKIAGPDDTTGLAVVRDAIRACEKFVRAVEKRRAELKKPALDYGRAVDAEAKRIALAIDEIALPLIKQKDEVEAFLADRARAEEAARLRKEREEAEAAAKAAREAAEAERLAREAAEAEARSAREKAEAEIAALRRELNARKAAEVEDAQVDASEQSTGDDAGTFAADQFAADTEAAVTIEITPEAHDRELLHGLADDIAGFFNRTWPSSSRIRTENGRAFAASKKLAIIEIIRELKAF